ncbi:hypothetical protein E2C01_087792 [Portunus trituberculatus]|uniref:Uncharacterized protein n=1 Tax=Portunus trituberculatus TaxID=210409 RepID=A0A5B7JI79_PORTR|nr:hypothetical protein [Portunus trituberculatus]
MPKSDVTRGVFYTSSVLLNNRGGGAAGDKAPHAGAGIRNRLKDAYLQENKTVKKGAMFITWKLIMQQISAWTLHKKTVVGVEGCEHSTQSVGRLTCVFK